MPATSAGGPSALLTGPLGTRSPTGTATVEGRTVRVTWSGDQPGSTRPWYVHRGSCGGRDQGMVGAASAYRPITVDSGGAGTGAATLPAPLDASGAYYVAVHTGAQGAPSDVMACGALGGGGQMSGMAGMDHSTMNMSGNMSGMSAAGGGAAMPMGPSMARGAAPSAGGGNMASGNTTGSNMAATMADHMRMMADHMRMMGEHMAMMAQMAGADGATAMPTGSTRARSGATSATRRPARPSAARASGSRASGSRATASRSPSRPAPAARPATPAPKRDPMAGMDHSKMPGMDHSKMPGMGKP